MKPQRVKNPAIPGTTQDRTGTAGIVRRAVAEIRRRWTGLSKDVLAVFDRIPVYEVNDVSMARVMYGLTPADMAATSYALEEAFFRWLEVGREEKNIAWWSFTSEAQQLGTAQSVSNLINLSQVYAAARSLADVVYSEPYRNRAAMAQVMDYEHFTGLSETSRSTLSQIIGKGVIDGKNPKVVRREIQKALDVSRSKAEFYAQTATQEALRSARAAEADWVTENIGLNIGLLWTSALLPTTRQTHASRNGKVYTTDEVRAFYERDGNRYRCHCAQTECLLDADNKPILSQSLKDAMAKERADWERSVASSA